MGRFASLGVVNMVGTGPRHSAGQARLVPYLFFSVIANPDSDGVKQSPRCLNR